MKCILFAPSWIERYENELFDLRLSIDDLIANTIFKPIRSSYNDTARVHTKFH
jgi:hypothetical protein